MHTNAPYAVPIIMPPSGTIGASTKEAAHIARVKAAILRSAQNTLDNAGFTQVIAPTFTQMSGACGEPGTLIPVKLAGGNAFLRQTAQLHLEPLMRELGAVYSVGRSFRAERKSDHRHLTEFTLIEGEVGGWTLDSLMSLMEEMIVSMVRRAGEIAPNHKPAALMATPFRRMTYDEAIVALQGSGYFIEWGEDLAHVHEIALTEMVGGPLFITHYPAETRFFTMKICRQDPRVVECCDLLLPGVGEVMGASETETDPNVLETRLYSSKAVRQAVDLGGSVQDYEWYVQMRRTASDMQAGFGMGFERMVRYVCGLTSISQAI
ncbi:MAG TPA: amino acid--tRNA ligase-related protein [Chloroflexia bacterium]|nr:amino acid--tRNA ligase-related protein [Chloroflexia bacterium]